MSKLLNRSMKAFVLYAGIVFACSIPVYYAIVDLIWQHELKEHNHIVSETIKQNLQALSLSDTALTESVLLWNKLRPENQLQLATALQPDSTYNLYRKNKYIPSKGYDRFQGLVTYFLLNNQPYRLTLETNMEETHETIVAIAVVTFTFFLILLVGFIFINRKISEKLWRPFYQSLRQIQTFDLHKPNDIRFAPTDIEEFTLLNHQLDKLITGNIAIYKQQKEFTQNASHELQTPLSIVKFKLDLLYQSKTISDEQSELIDQAHQALAKVTRINKNLLLLARIENSQFPETAIIDLPDLIADQLLQLEDFLQEKSLQVVQQLTPGVKITGNQLLVEILLTNLLINAIRHSAAHQTITVKLTPHSLEISNPGATALQESILFRRFGTFSSNASGTGLGLAIVHQICSVYGWQECYHFENDLHIFSIRWA
ncbi:sensor histidine kinase [Chitinophaga nivalis]|uniref:histidine kinase n=1 Tax=Chitinophaga nivalis TaxID=2991709 RepID=A0ABT3IQ41_9BACT|nr:HAMP domain-containing sensor histidine kinase [Chitinophaga nivalis]MCW3464231.1 HAMP domain-containing histidine kinase [Chitinophaga nivalis]MCW3486079.1 HAMP domain-containing histidine kinase [Chitinophaga nivalis]